ncbi:TetR/AcrR family transcriptional regulator [Oscillochloris sp. ZM17-4]|uniref:TetR/AcrR family transcriptional regulator n=1 Tax=Oscillochloris sp. ZM17-4 TaxID=2866714 RepID=UPI001C730551|nr:TetR/AcrR family transcriptional regulator [Oscillochloris sp. ZM17-4]MBX0328550.1 TetR/AcrR family transcriptional regulator [Oscillochloris sp. ZM17-4]
MAEELIAGERRERRDVQRNMERVLQAAQELFAERGPDVKMEEIAQRAGVGVGTIYRRFPSKDQLFAAVREAVCQSTRHCLAQAADDTHDPLEQLRAIIMVQYRQSARQAALIDLRPNPADAPVNLDHPGLYASLHALLTRVIASGQRQGSVRDGDPLMLAAICLELLSPRTVQNLSRLVGDDVEAAADHVILFLSAGLAV